MAPSDLNDRLADHWRRIDDHDEASFGAGLEALLDALPVDDPLALFERGAAFDSFGHPTSPCRCTGARSTAAWPANGAVAR